MQLNARHPPWVLLDLATRHTLKEHADGDAAEVLVAVWGGVPVEADLADRWTIDLAQSL